MNGSWLTYEQAGARLGISPEAVRHRARRQHWRHQKANDGRVLVLVPDPVHTPVQPVQDRAHGGVHVNGVAHGPEAGEIVAVWRKMAAVLQDQLGKAEGRADQERAGRLAAERHAADLRRLLDADLAALKVEVAALRQATPPTPRPLRPIFGRRRGSSRV